MHDPVTGCLRSGAHAEADVLTQPAPTMAGDGTVVYGDVFPMTW
ncbi:hypothetical protein ACIA5G_39255 [Amycolatopsis sp. NPDC051758]